MLFYSAIFFIIAFLTFYEEGLKPNKRAATDICMILVLGTVSAFHGIGGTDWDIYLAAYNRVPGIVDFIKTPLYYQSQIFYFEIGYLFIISAFKTFGLNFHGYLFCQAIIFYCLIYKGLRRFTNHWGLVMLVFIYKMFIYDTFVAMRQELTIAGFFILLPYLYERNAKKYFVGCILLTMIHMGAVILFCVYILNYIKLTKRRLIILLSLFLPTVILAQMGLGGKLNTIMLLLNASKGESYSTSTESLSIAYTLEYYLLMGIIVINYNRIILLKYAEFIIKLCLIMLPMVTLFSGVVILRREMDYFFPLYGVLGGYLCNVKPNLKFLIILIYIIICYYGFQRYLHNFDYGGMLPYRSWL
ncbi:MAG: EpsG family protein [Bacteroides sp.]|nr:EpsG family protein [Bacteroides sp.]